jgi:hypothetical protein
VARDLDDPLETAWREVERAMQIVGGHRIDQIPGTLSALIESGNWRHYRDPLGKERDNTDVDFRMFVTAEPFAGLGASVETLEHVCIGTPAADLLEGLFERPGGRPKKTVDNVNGSRPVGNARDQALRRLRRQRPDLHARVLAGELSAHRAAIEAGFRQPTISVPVDSVEHAIEALLRRFTPEELLRALGEVA